MLTPEAEQAYRRLPRADRRRIAHNAPPELRAALRLLELRMQAERSPADLARIITGGRELQAPHLDLIDDAFAKVNARRADRVGLFMPPRHGKSRRVRWAVLWYLMLHPYRRVIIASYAASLAETHGRWLRDTIAANHELLNFHLRTSSRAAARWDIDATEGGLIAVGVGGGATGNGADIVIIDDPVKDAKDAESVAIQDDTWDWWNAVAQTRLEPGGAVVLIQTRWSPGDLGGRILADDPDRWSTVDLPAIALTDDEYRALDIEPVPDPLGRAPGEALWPERYPPDVLAGTRRGVGERVWWALYQQQPRSPKGTLLSSADMRTARILASEVTATPTRRAVAVDPSGGGRDTAGIIAGWLGNDQRLYLTHDRTGVMPSDAWAREACLLAHETSADRIIIEKNYGGDMASLVIKTAWKALADEGAVEGFPPLITSVSSTVGKLLRAEPIAGQFREGRIHIIGALPKLEHEWTTWLPGTASPGRIDASVHLAHALLPAPSGPAQVVGGRQLVQTSLLGGRGNARR